MVISFAATLRDRQHACYLGVWDVSVAFFHAQMDERIVVIPPVGEEESGYCWELLRAMCGTRRASSLFENKVMEVLSGCGFVRLAITVQLFWDAERRILVAVHGDDFLAAATWADQDWLDSQLRADLEIKRQTPIGPAEESLDE